MSFEISGNLTDFQVGKARAVTKNLLIHLFRYLDSLLVCIFLNRSCYLAKTGPAILLPAWVGNLGIMSGFSMLLLKSSSVAGILKMNSSENTPLEDFSNFFKNYNLYRFQYSVIWPFLCLHWFPRRHFDRAEKPWVQAFCSHGVAGCGKEESEYRGTEAHQAAACFIKLQSEGTEEPTPPLSGKFPSEKFNFHFRNVIVSRECFSSHLTRKMLSLR